MEYIKNIREKTPLIHFITNYVTVNDVANATLAIGASPIMTDEIKDVKDMQNICNALVINIGTLIPSTYLIGLISHILSKLFLSIFLSA